MELFVREIKKTEIQILIEYFYGASPEHLERMGVDPTRLPSRKRWTAYYESELTKPYEQRETVQVIWLADNVPVGISTADTIRFGESAKMHLHVLRSEDRHLGIGTNCVRQSAEYYFTKLKLKKLTCEPNAFNIAPNRTLQKAGFKYLKTHKTVPNRLNYHQAVTKWVMER